MDGEAPSQRSRTRARHRARRLALQALYQWQIGGQPYREILEQFGDRASLRTADTEYFHELVEGVATQASEIDRHISEYADRKTEELDPVEHGALMIGVYELLHRVDVPYRVVINEAVELSKCYGAEDGHKYVNALLDRAARDLRSAESGRALTKNP